MLSQLLKRDQDEGERPMKNTSRLLALYVAIALSGCSESASRPQASCELMTERICSLAAEAQLHDGALAVSYAFRPEEARVVPFVVPVSGKDGILAAEVDCYANTDSHSYSIVRSDLAISPESQESVDFLRDRHLCADESSYAKGRTSRCRDGIGTPNSLTMNDLFDLDLNQTPICEVKPHAACFAVIRKKGPMRTS